MWLKELRTHSNPDAKVFLIGNKLDLEERYIVCKCRRKIGKQVANKLKDDLNMDSFMETSAKTGFNVKNVFVEAAKTLYTDYLKYKDKVDSVIIFLLSEQEVLIVNYLRRILKQLTLI
jgi:GTPase SAR1 family protein